MKYFALIFALTLALAQGSFIEQFEKFKAEVADNETNSGNIWVLVVAGSHGYENYRHQSDVCHAYHVVHNHGVPDSRIVVMMYDDIANNWDNPRKGQIFNAPGGTNVYVGVPKDYTGNNVTPTNFLNVLKGNSAAMRGKGSGKVIGSGPNDHVFVFFSGHGNVGILGFPAGGVLWRNDLNNAINSMHSSRKYSKMVLYIEACYSGSMFSGLASNINVYATTAANDAESSYACYWDGGIWAWLGDRYSVSWMEDSDSNDIRRESLSTQFDRVKRATTDSHVMDYGQKGLKAQMVSEFQGRSPASLAVSQPGSSSVDDVPSYDVPLHMLRYKMTNSEDPLEKLRASTLLKMEEESRRQMEWTMLTIAQYFYNEDAVAVSRSHKDIPKLTETEEKCYEAAVQAFSEQCYSFAKYDYAMSQLYVLGNLCDSGVDAVSSTNKILEAIRLVCA